ncbi:MAG: CPXCG motif-containing cysteine-rich protein [Pseudomonadota bacterium]|nr:CPXCG motif-containing cysteine-rich protein [Pseudomonadota bacterium]
MSALVEDVEVLCPYCGQTMEIDVDCTAGNQKYFEDCRVCCSPIQFSVSVDNRGNLLTVDAQREND